MILLTMDIGNTSASVAVFSNDKLFSVVTLNKVKLLQQIKSFLKQLRGPVEACLVASVAGKNREIINLIRKHTRVILLNKKLLLPIKNKYRTPNTLGNDRLACAVGAAMLFPKRNVLVIDAGTCIKYDFVNNKGHYLGGSITPGLNMRLQALHQFTAALPLVKPAQFNKITGRTTEESILSGVLQGIKFEMEGFVKAYNSQVKSLKVVVTGGDYLSLAKGLKNDIFAAPNLIHIGLYDILKKNLA